MIIPTGYAQVNLRFTGAGVPSGAEMTFGLQNVATLTADQIADFVGDTLSGANFDGYYTAAMSLTTILVKLGPNATGASSELGYVIDGTATGEAMSPNVSVLISKITGLGGRQGRGRMFLPCVSETSCGPGGELVGGYAGSLQTAMTNFLGDMDTGDLPLVLLHNTGSPGPTPITSFNVSPILATQRRRLRR